MFSKEAWEKIIKSDRFRKKIEKLSSETLFIILNNPDKAHKYAQQNIDKSIPENLKEEYVKMMVKAMQEFAKILLEKRKKSK